MVVVMESQKCGFSMQSDCVCFAYMMLRCERCKDYDDCEKGWGEAGCCVIINDAMYI